MINPDDVLDEIVAGWRDMGGQRQVLIHCAHYALFWKERHAVDCFELQEDPSHPAGYFSNFSRTSAQVGLQLSQALKAAGANVKLCVLVNDWQYLESSRSLIPLAQRARGEYFERAIQSAPPALQQCLLADGDQTVLFGAQWRHALQSESELRRRFVRRVLDMDPARLEQLGLVTGCTPSGDPTFELRRNELGDEPVGDTICLVYGGNTNCAGEVIELLCEIDESHAASCFINLFPVECENHVNIGTRIYRQLQPDTGEFAVINVPLGAQGEVMRNKIAYL